MRNNSYKLLQYRGRLPEGIVHQGGKQRDVAALNLNSSLTANREFLLLCRHLYPYLLHFLSGF